MGFFYWFRLVFTKPKVIWFIFSQWLEYRRAKRDGRVVEFSDLPPNTQEKLNGVLRGTETPSVLIIRK
jgi:hypothetical protein